MEDKIKPLSVKKIKESIGYSTKPSCCGNCHNFTFAQKEVQGWRPKPVMVDFDFKCGLHNFATKKMAWCKEHKRT